MFHHRLTIISRILNVEKAILIYGVTTNIFVLVIHYDPIAIRRPVYIRAMDIFAKWVLKRRINLQGQGSVKIYPIC